jgi:hypothetical protein
MASSAILSAAVSASLQSPNSLGPYKHSGHHSRPLTDIDAQGSSVAAAPSSSGKVGSKLDVTA